MGEEEKRIKEEVTDRYSLRGRVFQAIREKILSGEYKHGLELRETALASEMGVSRTPVREALRQLELEGLVKIIPNKGASVVGHTAEGMDGIFGMSCLLVGDG